MPEWVKVRADFRPMPQGFALLDQASLLGDPDWTYVGNAGLPSGCFTSIDNPVRFRKDGQGWVHLCGGFSNASGATIPITQNLLVLPAGYRPRGMSFAFGGTNADRPHFYVYLSNAASGHARVHIDLDGQVRLNNTGMAFGANLEFSHVSFYAEN